MVRPEAIIAIKDVSKKLQFLSEMQGYKSTHGGNTFEILTGKGVILFTFTQLKSLHLPF